MIKLPEKKKIQWWVKLGLQEDLGEGDITSDNLSMKGHTKEASLNICSSTKLLPTLMPLTFKKVYDIAPPIRMKSALLRKYLITPSLDETFAPPNTTDNFLLDSRLKFDKYFKTISTIKFNKEVKKKCSSSL